MNPLLVTKVGGDLAERREAVFSKCGKYRFILKIVWDETLPLCQFIGLNPSTADENRDDATIRKCKGFARRWSNGGIVMTNVFAYRATNPDDMMKQWEPMQPMAGPSNVEIILDVAKQCSTIVASWGNGGAYGQWGFALALTLQNERHRLNCFKVTKIGQPIHPLYQKYSQPLQPFRV